MTGSSQGASVDGSNLDISTNAIVSYGAISAGNTQAFVQIEESSTGTGSWSAIDGMTCDGGTSGNSNTTQVLRGLRAKQYVRANVLTVAGTTASAAVSVVLVSQGKYTSAGTAYGSGFSNYPSS